MIRSHSAVHPFIRMLAAFSSFAAAASIGACGTAPSETSESAEAQLTCPTGTKAHCEYDVEARHVICDECVPVCKQWTQGNPCTPCGDVNQDVCGGEVAIGSCKPGLTRYNGVCKPCSGLGQPVCADVTPSCAGGLENVGGFCQACGEENQPICKTREACNSASLEGYAGTCIKNTGPRPPWPADACGHDGQSCCANAHVYSEACVAGLVCRPTCLFDSDLFCGDNTCQTPKPTLGGGTTTQLPSDEICDGAAVPKGQVIVDKYNVPTACGNPTMGQLNVDKLESLAPFSSGMQTKICAGQAIPAGWKQVGAEWDPTRCSRPQDPSSLDVISIQKN